MLSLSVQIDGPHVLRQVLSKGLEAVHGRVVEGVVDELAARLATGPTRAYAGMKRQFNEWLFRRMDAQLELEASIQQQAAASGDFSEGVQAFLERRAAAFEGR